MFVDAFGPHGGAQKSRAHGVDCDIHGADLFGQRLGEPDHRELGGAIGRYSGSAGFTRYGGDVDDAALASLGQFGNGRLAAEEDALDVDLHGLVPLCLGGFHYRTHSDDAGVVDEDIDPAKRSYGLGHHTLGIRGFGHIRQHGNYLHSQCLDLTAGLFEQRFVAELIRQARLSWHWQIDQGEIDSLSGEFQSDAFADTTRGASDDSDFTFELHAASYEKVQRQCRTKGEGASRLLSAHFMAARGDLS